MPSDYELKGTVVPETDGRALERETGRMEQAFNRATELTPSLDLSTARRQVEGLLDRVPGVGSGIVGGQRQQGRSSTNVSKAMLKELTSIRRTLQKDAATDDGGGAGAAAAAKGTLAATGVGGLGVLGGALGIGGGALALSGYAASQTDGPVGGGNNPLQMGEDRSSATFDFSGAVANGPYSDTGIRGTDKSTSELLEEVPDLKVDWGTETGGIPDISFTDQPEWMREWSWPELPDLASATDWPELPELSESVDFPEYPDLASTVDWPEFEEPPWLSRALRILGGDSQSSERQSDSGGYFVPNNADPTQSSGVDGRVGIGGIEVNVGQNNEELINKAISELEKQIKLGTD
ncbi:hypothetical protein Hbl1158_10180 [Halobaculum sp. CBA1158]|uniref:hypothetical protein n=1 Tax=Halobaculum sp. CBA1158 TaxID=2904243 RepID=UPI001F1D718B|nr:hypothetical protein [Halobaculum sp. CBA1158]UIO98901.1 hypothetical protein Hbl1158_10180 [Halobaculum sp. CBA1158]